MIWRDAAELVLRGMMSDLPDDEAAEILDQAARVCVALNAVDASYLRQMTLLDLCLRTATARIMWEVDDACGGPAQG